VDFGPVVFPASGFPRKNLGVDLCDCCIIFVHCLIMFLLHKEGKRIGTCELYSAVLIRLVVPRRQQNLLCVVPHHVMVGPPH